MGNDTDTKTYYVLTAECELSSGGWCFTHSTGDGPIYCVPLQIDDESK